MTRSHRSRPSAGALILIASLALAACTRAGSGSTPPGASALPSSEPSSAASEAASVGPSASAAASETEPTESLAAFACTPSVTIPATTDRAQITDVRVGTHDAYDRIVFEFASGIPQTVIDAVLPPFYADPSGLPIDVNGTAFLRVVMHGGTKVSPAGGTTYAGQTNFEPDFDQLAQLIEGGDFEAISTWYLGLKGGGCLRVLTLADPSRLVIDIEH
jgi:hypothetical protein